MPNEAPLRILVITSRPLIDSAGNSISLLDVEEERRRISTGLKNARIAAQAHFLPEATTGAVKTALREKWDVVHFTGHGTPDGRLVLEDGLGVAHFLSKEETAQLFTGQAAPLVVLSACYSETIRRSLLGASVPAVVAIEASLPIADRAALWASASRDEGEYKLRDLASLLSIAGRVFKLPITEQTNFDEQKQVVRGFFEESRAIVILDNWEMIEGRDRRELWDFMLSLPETVRVLVTSRDVLPPKQARNIELDTLASDDAFELFVNVARNTGYFDKNPSLSADEIAILNSICERLSGYPLAIESHQHSR